MDPNANANGLARYDPELHGFYASRPPTYGLKVDELENVDAAVTKPPAQWTKEEQKLIIRAAEAGHPAAAKAIYGPPLTKEDIANAAAMRHFDVPLNRFMTSSEWSGIYPDEGPCLWPVREAPCPLRNLPEEGGIWSGSGHTSGSGGTGKSRDGDEAAGKSQGR